MTCRSDAPRMTAELDLPVGTAIERTEEVVNQIEQYLTDEFLVNGERSQGFTSWTIAHPTGEGLTDAVELPIGS